VRSEWVSQHQLMTLVLAAPPPSPSTFHDGANFRKSGNQRIGDTIPISLSSWTNPVAVHGGQAVHTFDDSDALYLTALQTMSHAAARVLQCEHAALQWGMGVCDALELAFRDQQSMLMSGDRLRATATAKVEAAAETARSAAEEQRVMEAASDSEEGRPTTPSNDVRSEETPSQLPTPSLEGVEARLRGPSQEAARSSSSGGSGWSVWRMLGKLWNTGQSPTGPVSTSVSSTPSTAPSTTGTSSTQSQASEVAAELPTAVVVPEAARENAAAVPVAKLRVKNRQNDDATELTRHRANL